MRTWSPKPVPSAKGTLRHRASTSTTWSVLRSGLLAKLNVPRVVNIFHPSKSNFAMILGTRMKINEQNNLT